MALVPAALPQVVIHRSNTSPVGSSTPFETSTSILLQLLVTKCARQVTIERPWVFTHHTDWSCQYRSWPEMNHPFLWAFLVSVVRHVRFTSKEYFYIHKSAAEQVIDKLVTNEVLLKNSFFSLSDYEEDSIDVQSFSNLSSVNSMGGAYRAEVTD